MKQLAEECNLLTPLAEFLLGNHRNILPKMCQVLSHVLRPFQLERRSVRRMLCSNLLLVARAVVFFPRLAQHLALCALDDIFPAHSTYASDDIVILLAPWLYQWMVEVLLFPSFKDL